LEVTWFGPGGIEGDLSLRHVHTDYLRSGFTSARETTGKIAVLKPFGRFEGALSLAAGSYEDDSLPEDDAVWVELSPMIRRELNLALSTSISFSVSRVRYDSRANADGDHQTETHWQARPGFRWTPAPAVAIWGEGMLDANDANEDTEDYVAAGATAGLDLSYGGIASTGAWAQWLVREYPERFPDGSEDRRDTPLSLGVWVDLRLLPWAELTGAGQWLRYRSTESESDYDSWSLEAGLRLVFDWKATGETDR
jgi:hypothetical protein